MILDKRLENCVILAGGKSSRMGRDKSLMRFGGFDSLAEFQANKFAQIFKNVYVSAKDDKFGALNFPILHDKFADFSPMGALFGILENFKDDSVFIIPVDMAFVEFESVFRLKDEFEGREICVAKDDEYTHSLCGFFSGSVSEKAREFYENDIHKIKKLFENSDFKEVYFENSKQFFNINYMSDYEVALKRKIGE